MKTQNKCPDHRQKVQMTILKMRAKSILIFLKTPELWGPLISSINPHPKGPLFKLESPPLKAWLNNAVQWTLDFRLQSKETSFIVSWKRLFRITHLNCNNKNICFSFSKGSFGPLRLNIATLFLPGLLICTNSESSICAILNKPKASIDSFPPTNLGQLCSHIQRALCLPIVLARNLGSGHLYRMYRQSLGSHLS